MNAMIKLTTYCKSTKDTAQNCFEIFCHFLLIWEAAVVLQGKNNRIPTNSENLSVTIALHLMECFIRYAGTNK